MIVSSQVTALLILQKFAEQLKQRTRERRTANGNRHLLTLAEVLVRTADKNYVCPKCNKVDKSQDITNQVRSCTAE